MAIDVQNTINSMTEGNTGGQSIKDMIGPQQPAPEKEVSAISSTMGERAVKERQDTLTTIQSDKEDKTALLTELKRRLEQQKKATEAARAAEDEAMTTRVTVNADGEETLVEESPEIINAKKEVRKYEDSLNAVTSKLEGLSISSRELRDTFDSIREVYSARAERMKQINDRRVDALRTVGVRLGSRYTGGTQGGIFGGVIAEEERQGLERIDAIEAEMEGEIQKAKDAARDFNYSLYTQAADRAKELYKEKRDAALELERLAKEEQKKVDEETDRVTNQAAVIEQIGLGVKDPIEIFTALEGNVPYDMIKEITDTLPEAKDKEFKFITGSKYQSPGYFDPATGEFKRIDSRIAGDGTTVINGSSVGYISPGMTDVDIDSLNISASAKAYVKLWRDKRITQEEILQRLSGDKGDRNLRNEVIGVIAQMQEPQKSIDAELSTYNRNKATNAIDNVDTAIELLGKGAAGAKGRAFFGEKEGGPGGIGGFLGAGGDNASFVAAIESLKGMIALGELQTMRDNSPTGGALGQVTEKELDILASQIASLDIRQDDAKLKANLQKIKKSFARVRAINSPDTTPEQYKAQFPDASKAELDEIRARIKRNYQESFDDLSTKEAFNLGPWADGTTEEDVFDSIGLDE